MDDLRFVRLPQLDVLRFFAIFLVIGNHIPKCPPDTDIFLLKLLETWKSGGWIGVDLFFVLSGFLISGLLFREFQKTQAIDFKRFLIRRGFKIYPPFWTLILVTVLISLLTTRDFYAAGTLGELLFLQNYSTFLWEHTWSLAVEEHFYFFLCILFFLLLWLKKTSFEAIPKIALTLAITCLLFRFATAEWGIYNYRFVIEATHLRIDSLFFGVLISYFWNFKNLSENVYLLKYKWILGALGLICLTPAFIFEVTSHFWIGVLGVTFFYFGSGLLIVVFLKLDFSKSRFLMLLAAIGTYSYSIYLWNLPLQTLLDKSLKSSFGGENWWFFVVISVIGTFIVGIGMSKLIEFPMLKVRDRYFPTKTSAIMES